MAPSTALLGPTTGLPDTAWAHHRVSTGQQEDWTQPGTARHPHLLVGGKKLAVGIQAVPSLLASGMGNSLQTALFSSTD